MAVYRTYKCPECAKCFDFLHHPNDEPPPSFCPLCGANVSGEKKRRKRRKRMKQVDSLQSPDAANAARRIGVRTGIATQSVDGLYRGMEDASAGRAQDAADLLGVDVRSLNHMKMTNMKDNLRAGEMSHIPAAAAKIQGTMTDIVSPTGTPLGATFGMQGAAPPPLPGAPVAEMQTVMSSTFASHRNRVQATVAAGIKK